jgi:hypothetical protein
LSRILRVAAAKPGASILDAHHAAHCHDHVITVSSSYTTNAHGWHGIISSMPAYIRFTTMIAGSIAIDKMLSMHLINLVKTAFSRSTSRKFSSP